MTSDLFGETQQMKRCSRCGQYKPLTEFNYHTDTPMVHRQPYCRQCQKEYNREHSTSSGASGRTIDNETTQRAYNELYARYKRYRMALDAYKKNFNDEPTDRMAFEYELGL